MAKATAHESELKSLTPGDRNLRTKELSQECIDGTIALNSNENVTTALEPFWVDVNDLINSYNDDIKCDVDTSWPELNASCNFDFSNKTDEHAIAKSACEGAGGEIFLFDLDFSASNNIFGLEIAFSLEITDFPLCVDEDCDIDGVAAVEEGKRNEDTTWNSQAIVTPTCAESEDAIFLVKTKMKNGKKRPVKKKCKWLARKDDWKKIKLCKKVNSFKRFSPARDICFSTCCNRRT